MRLLALATLLLLAACVAPGGKKAADTAVNPISGTSITTQTVDLPPPPKPAKVKQVKVKPAKTAEAKPAETKPAVAKPAPPLPAPKPKRSKKVKPLPAPVAGQVDASLDAITAAEAKPAPDEAAKAKPKPTEEAPKPKTPEETAAEALLAASAAEPETPPELQSPEQARCLNKGGVWATAGKSGAKACVKRTKDAGKSCTKQTQCEGFCLARSGTCAPITPMFGCNDILQADGREVTLCID